MPFRKVKSKKSPRTARFFLLEKVDGTDVGYGAPISRHMTVGAARAAQKKHRNSERWKGRKVNTYIWDIKREKRV